MNGNKIIWFFLIILLSLSATLFYNTNREIFAWGQKEKCVVDPFKENKFTQEKIEKGKIPIGETTDETELFAEKLIIELDKIYNKGITIKDKTLSMRDEAEAEIDEAWCLLFFTSKDNNHGCVDNCPAVPCSCSCSCNPSGDCDCDENGENCDINYSLSCGDCNSVNHPCREISKINSIFAQITTHSINITNNYTNVETNYNTMICPCKKFIKLIEVKNLLPNDPNRWKITNKLLNSRSKLEQCLTGYGFPIQEGKVKMRTLSCRIALDKIVLGDLVILGFFEDQITDYPHCYPYYLPDDSVSPLKDAIRNNVLPKCKQGPNSNDCLDAREFYMDNWFCCEGE